MKIIRELWKKYEEIISYLFWGVATTCVSWGSYTMFVSFFSTGVIVANCLSWVLAVLFAYVTNKIWVFHSKSWQKKILIREFGMFVSARLATGIFEIVMVPACVFMGMNQTILGVEGALAKVVVSLIVVILNYIFSKLIIFKREEANK